MQLKMIVLALSLTGICRAQGSEKLSVPPVYPKKLQAQELRIIRAKMKLDLEQYRYNRIVESAKLALNLGSNYSFDSGTMSFALAPQMPPRPNPPSHPTPQEQAAAAAAAAKAREGTSTPPPKQ